MLYPCVNINDLKNVKGTLREREKHANSIKSNICFRVGQLFFKNLVFFMLFITFFFFC